MSRTAIVTGASRGIGRTVAKRLAKDGFDVVVTYGGNAKEPIRSSRRFSRRAGNGDQGGIGNGADVENLFAEALKAFGSVDVVVNNAGIMPLSSIGKADAGTFDKVIQTNLRGAFLVMAQAAQHVSPGGRIIAFSSSVLAKAFPTYGPYIASKAGVEGLVHVLACQRRRSRADRHGTVPHWQKPGADRGIGETRAPGAARRTGGYRKCGFFPGWGGRRLD